MFSFKFHKRIKWWRGFLKVRVENETNTCQAVEAKLMRSIQGGRVGFSGGSILSSLQNILPPFWAHERNRASRPLSTKAPWEKSYKLPSGTPWRTELIDSARRHFAPKYSCVETFVTVDKCCSTSYSARDSPRQWRLIQPETSIRMRLESPDLAGCFETKFR